MKNKTTPKVGNIIITFFQKQMLNTGSVDEHFLLLHMFFSIESSSISISDTESLNLSRYDNCNIAPPTTTTTSWDNLQAYSVLVEFMNNTTLPFCHSPSAHTLIAKYIQARLNRSWYWFCFLCLTTFLFSKLSSLKNLDPLQTA